MKEKIFLRALQWNKNDFVEMGKQKEDNQSKQKQ